MKELWPLCNTDGLVGALYHPDDGHVAPADVTMALAKGARTRGGEIYRQTKVTGIEQQPLGEWVVKTDKGDITCEHVVTATGSWARQTAAMVGLDIPVIAGRAPVHRHRAGTGAGGAQAAGPAGAGRAARERRLLLHARGAPGLHPRPLREGRAGLGRRRRARYASARSCCRRDLDRLEPHIDAAINRVPSFGKVGIKDCINGPIPYTPDGSPLIGPAWGLKNFWLAEGFSFGITAAGGAG